MKTVRAVRAVQTEVGTVLQNTDNGASFSTNLVGSRIWKSITKGLTKHEIVDQVSAEFGAPREQVFRDVEEFVKTLKQAGLLQEDASSLTI
jgi:hypothetical protein